MVVRRAFTLVRAAAAASLLMALVAAPTFGAECALAGPDSVEVGESLSIDGSGFTPSATVELEIRTDGAATDGLLLTSNGSGSFQISLTPETSEAGRTQITASDGACAAELVVQVLLPGAEASTEPAAAEPGGGAAPGAAGPPTDARSGAAGTGTTPTAPWLAAGALLLIGVTGRLVTRRMAPR